MSDGSLPAQLEGAGGRVEQERAGVAGDGGGRQQSAAGAANPPGALGQVGHQAMHAGTC